MMDPIHQINDAFTESYNHLQQLYDDNELEECATTARALLLDPSMPKYHRIKSLLILCSLLPNVDEAEQCRVEAEATYRIVRNWHAVGRDTDIERALAELRKGLDEADEVLTAELAVSRKNKKLPESGMGMHDGYDAEQEVQKRMAMHAEEVADYEARTDDPDELERIDLDLLGLSKEQSMAALTQKSSKSNKKRPSQLHDESASYAESAPSHQSVLAKGPDSLPERQQKPSLRAQKMAEESSMAGFGGGKPFQAPSKKQHKPDAQ